MASCNRRCLASWSRPRATVAAVIVTVLGLVSVLNGLVLSLQAAPTKSLVVAKSAGPTFQRDILPIFRRNCLRCHDANLHKGGLDLSNPERVLAGGESGPAVVPAQPDASRLYDAIHNGEMPLDHKTKVCSAGE